MISKIFSAALMGIDAYPVEIEINMERGSPFFAIVGLPDNAVKESKERVVAAIRNSGYPFIYQRQIIVNMAPADIKKEGSAYDLPIAIGIMAASGEVASDKIGDYMILGEFHCH